MNLYKTALFTSVLLVAVSAQAQTVGGYADVHDFGGTVTNANGTSGADGSQPQTSVVFDKAGNMYGTSQSGGPNNGAGMVWEITSAGVYKDLHDFGGTVTNANGKSGADGTMPGTGVTVDANGNIYGTTYEGGPNASAIAQEGSGLIWEITAAGVYKDLHDFGGTVTNANGQSGLDGFGSTSTVGLDSHGNFFGTCSFGGPNNAGIVWEITTSGVYKDLHDFGGSTTNANGQSGLDGQIPASGVTFDSAGNMFGTTEFGGPGQSSGGGYPGGGIVWEITPAAAYKDVHDFGLTITNSGGTSGPDGVDPFWNVTFDAAGNMYGTAQYGGRSSGDSNVGMVWEITKAGVYKDLHDFGATINLSDGSSGLDGEIPEGGVAIDAFGNLYGTTTGGGPFDPLYGGDGILWEINAAGVYKDLHDFGGTITNQGGESGLDGTYPGQITVDASGNLYGSAYYGGPFTDAGMLWKLSLISINVTGLTLSPTSLVGGNTSTGTLTISAAAPTGGYAVLLSSSTTSATVPVSATVASGATQTTFTVSTIGVSASTTATISAGAKTATLTINPAALASLSVTPTSVAGGNTATGKVTLTGNAAGSGAAVTLASANTLVKVPASVTVAAGTSSATFSISTGGVSLSTPVSIKATLAGATQSATLTLTVPVLSQFSVTPNSVLGGASVTATASLNGNAGTKGAIVTFASNSTSATLAAKSVTIPSGQSQAKVAVKTTGVPAQKSAILTAKSGAVTLTANLTIMPPSLSSVYMNPTAVVGGASATGTVTLSSVAGSGGVPVKLSSSTSAATPPASVSVGSGKSTATFAVKTTAVATQTSATITATLGSTSKTATLTINAPTLKSFAVSPTTVKGGANATGTVTLTSAAPKGGLTVSITSALSVASAPATLTVAAGSTTGKVTIKTSKVTASTAVTLTAKLGSTSLKATLTVH